MRTSLRAWWPWLKALLAVAIIGGVAWQFAKLLRSPELWEHSLQPRPGWLVVSTLLYMLAFTFPAFFWHRLLHGVGTQPPASASARAYFIAHLGKYVPGKALALVLRVGLIRGAGVSAGIATLTAMYETLTLMASGALLAVFLFSFQALESDHRWKAFALLAVAGIPILPGVFNRLVALLSRKAKTPLPRLRATTLLLGLALTSCTWALMGLSLGAALQALLPEAPPWDLEAWGRHTAFVATAYVLGFVTLVTPGGLGVREAVLQRLLAPELGAGLPPEQAAAVAAVVALVVRLVWTVGEVLLAAGAWFLPAPVGREPVSLVERPDDTVPSPQPTTDLRS
jgi:hypothetical protein